MKEIIYNIDGVAGRVITLTGLTGTFTKNNVLGIINKSQGDVLYTPMDWNLLTFAYSNGTMTLTLAESVAAIAAGDKLFIKLYSDDEASGSYDELIANWLGITEATEYTALTPAEAIAIARDCQYNVMGTDWPIPTWLPTGVTEAQVESAAEGLGIPYHEPTQTA